MHLSNPEDSRSFSDFHAREKMRPTRTLEAIRKKIQFKKRSGFNLTFALNFQFNVNISPVGLNNLQTKSEQYKIFYM